jgi:TonB family protein
MLHLLAALTIATLGSSPTAQGAHVPASCIADNAAAHIVEAVPAEYPPLAIISGVRGKTIIRVDLTDTGRVERSSVLTTSGSVVLDRAALQAANATRYAPETLSCTPIAGSYAVEVDFTT